MIWKETSFAMAPRSKKRCLRCRQPSVEESTEDLYFHGQPSAKTSLSSAEDVDARTQFMRHHWMIEQDSGMNSWRWPGVRHVGSADGSYSTNVSWL